MTPKQKQLLEFVRDYVEQHGISPTYVEMQAHLGLASKSGVARLTKGLIAQGHLERAPGGTRNLLPSIPKGHSFPSLMSVPTALLQAELARRGAVT